MDYNKSLKQNVQELKSEVNRIKSLQRISNRNLFILKENIYLVSRKIILGDPLERFELENELRIMRNDITELEQKIKLLKSIRVDLEQDTGAEYVGFGKKKLLEMKDYMVKNGIDILRKRFILTDYNKDEIDIFVESVMGFDTVRIEGVAKPEDILFLYNNMGMTDTVNGKYDLSFFQTYSIKVDKEAGIYILTPKNFNINYERIEAYYINQAIDVQSTHFEVGNYWKHNIYGQFGTYPINPRAGISNYDAPYKYGDYSFFDNSISSTYTDHNPSKQCFQVPAIGGCQEEHFSGTNSLQNFGFNVDEMEALTGNSKTGWSASSMRSTKEDEHGFTYSISTWAKRDDIQARSVMNIEPNVFGSILQDEWQPIWDYDIRREIGKDISIGFYIIESIKQNVDGFVSISGESTYISGKGWYSSGSSVSSTIDSMITEHDYVFFYKIKDMPIKQNIAHENVSLIKAYESVSQSSGYTGEMTNPIITSSYTPSNIRTGTIASGFSCQINNKFMVYSYIINDITYIPEDFEETLPQTLIPQKRVMGIINISDENLPIGYKQEWIYDNIGSIIYINKCNKIIGQKQTIHAGNYNFIIVAFNPFYSVISENFEISIEQNEKVLSVDLGWNGVEGATGYALYCNGRLINVFMGEIYGTTLSSLPASGIMNLFNVGRSINNVGIGTQLYKWEQ
jgi:hypothetical protein